MLQASPKGETGIARPFRQSRYSDKRNHLLRWFFCIVRDEELTMGVRLNSLESEANIGLFRDYAARRNP